MMRDINETEIRIYSLICSNDGIKARDIARKVGVEKADINRLLYNAPFIHWSISAGITDLWSVS